MRIATAAYPPSFLSNWDAYVAKITEWVTDAAGNGAELCVFPEYGALEVATLDGAAVARDLHASIDAVSRRIDAIDALHSDLATKHGMYILASSIPIFDASVAQHPVNRARFFSPTGSMGIQDKQIMTRFECEIWGITPGGPLRLFDTALGKIGILICYDAEFPLLGRALSEADVILVPSVTEACAGFNRVRIGARARALENQCVTAMASLVGSAPWSEVIDTSTGQGGVFGPPDVGFPCDGILSQGLRDEPGWTYADVDLGAIANVRADGVVLNQSHWREQIGRDNSPPLTRLR